ncbi:MAG: hypothetical protein ACUVTX_08650 [Bacteroidales bacterium]
MNKIKRNTTFIIFFLASLLTFSQEIYHPQQNQGIYRFLDELSGSGIISINQTIKPYSRQTIALCLSEALEKEEKLTLRQKKELSFYLRDFGKEINNFGKKGKRFDLFYYSDSLFSITFNPVGGGEIFQNSSGKAWYWCNGIEVYSTLGRLGIWASLKDNHENPLLGQPEYLTQRLGGHIKNRTDWSDMRAGISYAWKWGCVALVHDNLQWGSGYNGTNIFSGHTPLFFQIKLNIKPVKWLDFNYFHGSLKSMVVDSARSYWVTNSYGTDYREVYHTKYIAANMFTLMPFKRVHISAGNSIVYSDYGINPVFLIPVLFFKSVDHSINSGIDNMNSQMFFDISSTQIRNLHLYATAFIDELSVKRFFKDNEWNFLSYKTGAVLFNLPFPDFFIIAEFTYTYPLTFQHYVPTLTFESNLYNLGHYLKDNSREWYFSLSYRPVRTFNINLWYCDAVRGPDYTQLGGPRLGNPPLETIEWHNRSAGLKVDYQLINDLYVCINLIHSNITGNPQWSPEFFQGLKTTVNFGIYTGF